MLTVAHVVFSARLGAHPLCGDICVFFFKNCKKKFRTQCTNTQKRCTHNCTYNYTHKYAHTQKRKKHTHKYTHKYTGGSDLQIVCKPIRGIVPCLLFGQLRYFLSLSLMNSLPGVYIYIYKEGRGVIW